MKEIHAFAHPENGASIKVLQKNGFLFQGFESKLNRNHYVLSSGHRLLTGDPDDVFQEGRSDPQNGEEMPMDNFPDFMRRACNRISSGSQYTPGIEGYAFDGADGSQITIWTSANGGDSAEHVHEYDEYFTVVQGQYTVILEGKQIPVGVGGEYVIPRGVPHAGRSIPGTRTINAFGGKRARRETENA